MGGQHRLFVGDDAGGNAVMVVVEWLGSRRDVDVVRGTDEARSRCGKWGGLPVLETAGVGGGEASEVAGVYPVSVALVGLRGGSGVCVDGVTPCGSLVGAEGSEEGTAVESWSGWAQEKAADLGAGAAGRAGALGALDGVLQGRTFLVGSRVTLADALLYAGLHGTVAGLSEGERTKYASLVRWFDHIQWGHCRAPGKMRSLPKAAVLPEIDLKGKHAAFAPPAIEVKVAADKGKDKGKGQEGGKDKGKDKGKGQEGGKDKGKGQEGGKGKAPGGEGKGAKEGEPPANGGEGNQKKKEKKEKKAKPPPEPKKEDVMDCGRLDIRVGTIVDVKQHPDADALYVESIDLGEEGGPRTIVSGLVKFVPLDKMQGRRVLVLTNLKPSKLRGVESHGMVLCASSADRSAVEPVAVPEGVPNGERVTLAQTVEVTTDVLNAKKKEYDKYAPLLTTDAEGVAHWDKSPFMTTKGPCTSSLKGGTVS